MAMSMSAFLLALFSLCDGLARSPYRSSTFSFLFLSDTVILLQFRIRAIYGDNDQGTLVDRANHVNRFILSRQSEDEVRVAALMVRIVFDDLRTTRLKCLLQLSHLNPIQIALAFRVAGESR